MKKLMVLVCGMLLLPGIALSADVYKWKDADGKVRYSDIPPSGKIPYEKLLGGKPLPNAAPSPAADSKKPTLGDKEIDSRKRKAEAENLQKKEQEKLDEQKVREQNCATAKANMQSYKQGGRMYKIDEKGERQYLEDKDIADGLAKANKEVEQWCN